jgi:hypothetical protein
MRNSKAKMMENLAQGSWYYFPDHGQPCQIVGSQALWGETTCRAWPPEQNSVVRIPASRLKPIETVNSSSPDTIAYIAAAARVSQAGAAACNSGRRQRP